MSESERRGETRLDSTARSIWSEISLARLSISLFLGQRSYHVCISCQSSGKARNRMTQREGQSRKRERERGISRSTTRNKKRCPIIIDERRKLTEHKPAAVGHAELDDRSHPRGSVSGSTVAFHRKVSKSNGALRAPGREKSEGPFREAVDQKRAAVVESRKQ